MCPAPLHALPPLYPPHRHPPPPDPPLKHPHNPHPSTPGPSLDLEMSGALKQQLLNDYAAVHLQVGAGPGWQARALLVGRSPFLGGPPSPLRRPFHSTPSGGFAPKCMARGRRVSIAENLCCCEGPM
jgi:hypothetical protein